MPRRSPAVTQQFHHRNILETLSLSGFNHDSLNHDCDGMTIKQCMMTYNGSCCDI